MNYCCYISKNASKRFSGLGNPSKMPHVKQLRSEFLKRNNPMSVPSIRKKAIKNIIKTCAKPVSQHSLCGKFINKFNSINEASRNSNIGKEGISRCCHGKLKSSGGFVWKFMSDSEELGG